jgi:hypothetical protein
VLFSRLVVCMACCLISCIPLASALFAKESKAQTSGRDGLFGVAAGETSRQENDDKPGVALGGVESVV